MATEVMWARNVKWVSKALYYMACVCSRYNVRSDWLIVTEL